MVKKKNGCSKNKQKTKTKQINTHTHTEREKRYRKSNKNPHHGPGGSDDVVRVHVDAARRLELGQVLVVVDAEGLHNLLCVPGNGDGFQALRAAVL